MTGVKLILRSLRFYWRTHLGVTLGAAAATAVLVGALLVGDSVKGSLRDLALLRLGNVHLAMSSQERFFRAQLAGDLALALGAPAAPVLQSRGIAASSDGSSRADEVRVLGVDERFWALGGGRAMFNPPATAPGQPGDEVILNEPLARQLGAVAGDEIVLRVGKPSLLPAEAPMSLEASAVAFRLRVARIATAGDFGDFSLQANQVVPPNAFVRLSWLQGKLARPGRANLLLVGPGARGRPALEQAQAALRKVWQLADGGLELAELPQRGAVELRSDRVFLAPAVAAAALEAGSSSRGVLTYFVNEIRLGDRSTPYSMVCGMDDPDLKDDETAINSWLAEDLAAKVGDVVEVTYFVLGPSGSLKEQARKFRVRAVAPLEGAAADPTLMPAFPGIAEAENCRDWQGGVPINLAKLRLKDEQYWKEHRGTPKAFVTLRAAQAMWGNRFGNLTAVRYPLTGGAKERIADELKAELGPAQLGLFFLPLRQQALAGAAESMDFGQLFLGFSLFLIASAVLLTGLLFVLGIEQRSEEAGVLLAVGIAGPKVRRLLMAEGLTLAVVGGLIGLGAGIVYTQVMLHGLSTLWSGAVGGSIVRFHATAGSIAIGGSAGAAFAAAGMAMALRRISRAPVRQLLCSGAELELNLGRPSRKMPWPSAALAAVAMLAAGATLATFGSRGGATSAWAFFAAGAAMLVGSLAAVHGLFLILARRKSGQLTPAGLGLRNVARRRHRSLAIVALVACAAFLIIAVGANRQDSAADAWKRSSGTGGFALLGRSALPLTGDFSSPQKRKEFGLSPQEAGIVSVVGLRLHEGDEASCLNLNRPQQPRLLGVQPAQLQRRGAFLSKKGFTKVQEHLPAQDGWMLLDRRLSGDAAAAIADEATVVWAMGKSVGAEAPCVDESGRTFNVRIVATIGNSILQGGLVISEENFLKHFPSAGGYRVFLIDAPPSQAGQIARAMSRAGQDVGLEIVSAARRLSQLNSVENTYLSIFQTLGALGLLLGTAGLGIVVLRNVMERRGELAMLRAVGFSTGSIQWMLLAEHGALLLAGLVCGAVSAILAVAPAIRSTPAEFPWASLAWTVLAVAAVGLASVILAARAATGGALLAALRNE